MIGTDSYTSFSDKLLEGTADLSKLEISSTVAKYLKSLKRNKEIISTEKENVIPLEEFKSRFKNWKEATTTSPSGRHLGHMHSLLKPDGTPYSDEVQNFNDRMLSLYHIITSTALLNSSPLNRWLVSIVVLIPKDSGQPKINRLRIINTFEADYKLVLK